MAHILIVAARFYEDIADALLEGATTHLEARGATYDVLDVPGAFEIPAAIRMAMNSGKYDGYVALGCVIRGETTHYDYVCSESARGLMQLSTAHALAIGNGILTVENRDQAWARAGVDQGNKGEAAATAALHMVKFRQAFGVSSS